MRAIGDWLGTNSFVSFSTVSFVTPPSGELDYVTVVAQVTAVADDYARLTWEIAESGFPASVPVAALEGWRMRIQDAEGNPVWVQNTGLELRGDGTRIIGSGWNAHRTNPIQRARATWGDLAVSDQPSFVDEISRWSRPAEVKGSSVDLPKPLPAGGAGRPPPRPPTALSVAEPPDDDDESSGGSREAISAILSWAHREESWSHDREEAWKKEVLQLTNLLRESGINADIDLAHDAETDIDWGRFGPKAIQDSNYVFVVVSSAWTQRWDGKNDPELGAGAVAEADTLRGLFEKHQQEFQRRVKLIVLPSSSNDDIPLSLRRLSTFPIDPSHPESVDGLIRHLTDQPTYHPPPVGPLKVVDGGFQNSTPAATGELLSRLDEIEKESVDESPGESDPSRWLELESIYQTLVLRGLAVGDDLTLRGPPTEAAAPGDDRVEGEALLRRVRSERPDTRWIRGRCDECGRPIPIDGDVDVGWVCSRRCRDRWYARLHTLIDPSSEEEAATRTPNVVPYWI